MRVNVFQAETNSSKMEMIEIDRTLFVTCRLCLDNLGVYQIVPSVQQQIKFCYDIEVHPFDRLPQLICKSCESVLSKYFEIKTSYVNKQKTLKTKLEIKPVTPISVLELESEPEPEPEPEPELEPESELERENALEPGSEPENEPKPEDSVNSPLQFVIGEKDKKDNNEVIVCDASSYKSTETDTSAMKKIQNKKPRKRIKRLSPDSWELEYDKWFTCRFCNKHCKTRCGMVRHINTHPILLQKYNSYIDKGCSVRLEKVDSRPNLCNSEEIVVHNMDKFISSNDNFYYTLFKQKRMFDTSNDEVYSVIENMSVQNTDKSPESSDSEPVFRRNKKKRIRLISKSSNETVILENNNKENSSHVETNTSQFNMVINGNECINLDDSSDTVSFKSVSNMNNHLNKNSLASSNQTDCKIIQNIISVCFKKYVRKFENNGCVDKIKNCTKNIDSPLKHQALSFGKKIIDNSEINCIGILKYLEFHNLDVVWIPRHVKHSNKNPDPVQVTIKLKSPEVNEAQDCGWTVLQDLKNPIGSNTIDLSEENCVENETLKENLDAHPSTDKPSNTDKSKENNDSGPSDQTSSCTPPTISDKDLFLKKLLNANPVQNPKQLRKKTNAQETQSAGVLKKIKEKEKPALPASSNETAAQTANNVSQMPIITSTISLAPVVTENVNVSEQEAVNEEIIIPNSNIHSNGTNLNDDRGSVNESQATVRNAPWIKVKPVTELMSNKALSTMNEQNLQGNIKPINQSLNMNLPYQSSSNMVYINPIAVQQVHNLVYNNQLPKPFETSSMPEKNMPTHQIILPREYVIMDSVDLPSTRTDSPFRYFQKLLHIKKIILLSGTESLPLNFHNLIKFKLVFQQDAITPVVLCLSLYCSKPPNSPARFCIKLRDMHENDIDITKLSAYWQWEILRVYAGDVVSKMLQNAQKINQTVYDCTKIFVSLLKEIKFQKTS